MASKTYTAQEMRKKAKVMLGGLGNGVITMPSQASSRDVAAMLRYAAGVVERANERRGAFAVNYGRVDYESDSAIVDEIDYILRGDAGKEDK